MIRLPPKSTRTDTLCPYTTLVRSLDALAGGQAGRADRGRGIDPLPRIVRHRCRKRFQPFGRQPLILFPRPRSEEHTSELQSLMRISYAVFCLKKKKPKMIIHA